MSNIRNISINTKIENEDDNYYDIVIGNGILGKLSSYIASAYTGKKIAVITDEKVFGIYGEKVRQQLESSGYKLTFVVVPAGEHSKSLEYVQSIYSNLINDHITRTDLIIALGGGVVGDLAGFVAATYLRGVPFIQIPTTLLAQVDSSIGGKVAVNLPEGKNLVGCFYNPILVFIDVDFLSTLPSEYISEGMAEVIKYACIEDAEFFKYLEELNRSDLPEAFEQIVHKCCSIKKKYVEEDPFDKGERLKLNFGHTIGHAIEKYYNYSEYTHGQAVAIGMYNIVLETENSGYTQEGTAQRLKNILENYNLDWQMPDIPEDSLKDIMKKDKKNFSEKLNFIYLKSIGNSNIVTKYLI